MNHPTVSRRAFVAAASAGALATWPAIGDQPRSPSELLNIGVVGAGGRGIDNIAGVKGENIAALCDVDERPLAEMAARYPKAKTYRDFRKLLDQGDLDAVIVATPDHTHAVAATGAMRRGLHVYCEKPLANRLYETQLMTAVAKDTKVVTQMGVQFHASAGFRRAVQILQAGVLGDVRQVHAWTSRPLWPQGVGRPTETPPVPDELDWDLWIGPAAMRPYSSAYHPRDWRGWWEFGSGALGDFLPHIFDPVYEGLALTSPTTVEAKSSAVNNETAPKWSIVEFQFPQRDELPAVAFTWHDGGKRPPAEIAGLRSLPPNGALVIGRRGKLLIFSHGKMPVLLPDERGERAALPELPPPPELTHWREWVAACKSGRATSANFQYGAALTDIALLGNLALRAGEKIQWDAARRRVISPASANQWLSREYRKGWEH